MGAAAAQTAWADEDAFYNITSAEVQQMNNAVQVVVSGDGVIAPDMDRIEMEHADYKLLGQRSWHYDKETSRPVEALTVHFRKARLLVNGLVPVGKYPISHLEFSSVGKANANQVDMRVCLYTKALLCRVKNQYWDDNSKGVDWGDAVRMDVALSEDQLNLVITIISDRLPDAAEHRTAQGLPDSAKELSIKRDGEYLSVHAKNAQLSDFVRELGSASGRTVKLEASVDRLVTAELPAVSFDDLVDGMCRCYGLTTAGSRADELVIGEAVAQSSNGYGRQDIQHIPLRWLAADKALGLLPNFLVRCVRTDKGNNQLVFCGSPEFADKLRADVTVIDRPARTVMVEVSLVEVSSTVDIDTALALGYRNAELSASLEVPSLQFGIAKSHVSPAEFNAKLDSLAASGVARSVSSAKLSAVSGEQGTIFAGVDKYIQVRDRYRGRDTVIPVKSGLSLTVKPLVTGRQIRLTLSVEISNINVVDPVTNMPVVDTRKANGTFQVASGESIVVGGLEALQDQVTRRRIPVLGYLPIIGSLFTTSVKQRQHSRLMLLLTPKIVEDTVAKSNS